MIWRSRYDGSRDDMDGEVDKDGTSEEIDFSEFDRDNIGANSGKA
jgi:hypothetical protein